MPLYPNDPMIAMESEPFSAGHPATPQARRTIPPSLSWQTAELFHQSAAHLSVRNSPVDIVDCERRSRYIDDMQFNDVSLI